MGYYFNNLLPNLTHLIFSNDFFNQKIDNFPSKLISLLFSHIFIQFVKLSNLIKSHIIYQILLYVLYFITLILNLIKF